MQVKVAIIVFIMLLSGCSKPDPDPNYDAVAALNDYQSVDPKQNKQLQLFMSYPLEERFRLHRKMRHRQVHRGVGVEYGFYDQPEEALKFIIHDLSSRKTPTSDFSEYSGIIYNLEWYTNVDVCKDEYIKPLRKIIDSYNLNDDFKKIYGGFKFEVQLALK